MELSAAFLPLAIILLLIAAFLAVRRHRRTALAKSLAIPCKTCERGQLVKKEVFRMSGPVVFIGYIMLIPSIIGVLICSIAFIAGQSDSANPDQGMALGMVVFIGIGCFVAGLFGWLLVMKKRILQCSVCGATISAS
jgi:drug/metabolite transporter (DMT)-like permease